MNTRRNFVGGLFGLAGSLLAITGFKAAGETKKSESYSDFDTIEERVAFDAGIKAAIQAGRGSAPSLGWKCRIETEFYQYILSTITEINYKDKTVTVHLIPNEFERRNA